MNRQFAIFIAIVQSILFFGHWLLYISVVTLLEIPDTEIRISIQTGIALLSISFVAASIYSFRSDSVLSRWFYSGAAVWLGTLHCLILASIAGYGLWLLAEISNLSLPTRTIGLGAFSLGLAIAAFALFRTHSPSGLPDHGGPRQSPVDLAGEEAGVG